MDFYTAKALLEWQVELGADEAICEQPLNRYEMPDAAPKIVTTATESASQPMPDKIGSTDAVAAAELLARPAQDLDALRQALSGFSHCDLKKGARQTVFADGNPKARVMVIGEAPGRDEDMAGRPFVGRAGQLLDKMFDAIGLGRNATDVASSLYITNIIPWRPPQNRDPNPAEIAMMMPFVKQHVALVKPEILVLMGNVSCQALLGKKGITRLRGAWDTALNLPALPMFHPAYLLRNSAAKREAWHDLLMLQARLRDQG